jgi:endoglucanase
MYEGVNINGGEFGPVNGDWRDQPWLAGTTLGTHYVYPSNQELDYFISKGMNTFRVPFKALHIMDVSAADDFAELDRVVDYAASKGATILLDMHDYGYTYTGKLIGRDADSNTEFASQWWTVASHFKTDANVLFGLMNEPHAQTATEWLSGANAAIAAIRAVGATQKILVPGSYWDGAASWVSSDNDTIVGTGVKDALNNYAFEVHQYLTIDGSGSAPLVPGAGSTRLVEVTQWARANNADLFLGEFAFTSDDAYMAEGKALIEYMHDNSDVWIGSTYWGAGRWWGDYAFSVEPTGFKYGAPLPGATIIDKPQMSILDDYLLSV